MDTTSPHEHTTIEHIKTRLDEMRVQIHLGGMEAEEEFDALLREVDILDKKNIHKTTTAARALLDRIRNLEARLVCPD